MAVSNTNKLYTWGASPQVLRLQAQAQKKIRILEQQEANEKMSKSNSLEELAKESTDSVNINEEIKEFLEDGTQTKTAQSEMITPNAAMQKKSENADLTSINLDFVEESQAHLKPSLVDTSLVKGQITQVC